MPPFIGVGWSMFHQQHWPSVLNTYTTKHKLELQITYGAGFPFSRGWGWDEDPVSEIVYPVTITIPELSITYTDAYSCKYTSLWYASLEVMDKIAKLKKRNLNRLACTTIRICDALDLQID